MEENKYIEHGKRFVAMDFEKKIWMECDKYAEDLWQSLRSKGLIHPLDSVLHPEALTSVIHANVLWHAPNAWYLGSEPSPLPPRTKQNFILALAAKLRKKYERQARKKQ